MSVSREELLSRLYEPGGADNYSVDNHCEETVLLLLSEGFVNVASVTRCSVVGIDSNGFACSRIR